jgi:threonine dehydrogenase-like Zn-dependent dehydrogenase
MNTMKAVRAHHRGGPEQLVFEEAPRPEPALGEVLVAVHASSITPDELTWEETWTDRSGPGGRDRTPIIPSHEMSGAVAALGPGVVVVACVKAGLAAAIELTRGEVVPGGRDRSSQAAHHRRQGGPGVLESGDLGAGGHVRRPGPHRHRFPVEAGDDKLVVRDAHVLAGGDEPADAGIRDGLLIALARLSRRGADRVDDQLHVRAGLRCPPGMRRGPARR